MQQCILGILTAIDKVCQEHNLKYYLVAGTMLGAIRHKGFIPWDDDADVGLPRKDYDILIAHANEWLPEEYELVSTAHNNKYPYQFARIQDKRTTYILRRRFDFVGGVPVDIFPLDGMTDNKFKQFCHYQRFRMVNKLLHFAQSDPYKHGKASAHFIVTSIIRKLFSKEQLQRTLVKIQTEYDIETSPLIADHDFSPKRGIFPKHIYGTPTQVSFENQTLKSVEKPHEYLRKCYGDYMTMPSVLPPVNFRYLDLDTPYQEYLRNKVKHR